MSELNVIALIREAAASPDMRAAARLKLAEMITEGDLLAHQTRKAEIRPSDFGTCVLSLWSTIHGKDDLPRDPVDDVLSRLDLGSLIGAWEGALLWAYSDWGGDWKFALEFVPDGGGHIDALAKHRGTGETVPIEFKSKYDTGIIKSPDKDSPQHLLQVGDYAHRTDSKRMILVYIKPPAKAGERMRQFEFEAAPYVALVAQERTRLAAALLDEPPIADPQARYACFTCRAGWCDKNKNKAANSVDALLA